MHMKMITLKELKDRFHPNLTKQQFAKEMGLANSVCSKMMRGRYDCSLQSKAWMDLCDYVRTKYNLQLVSENKFAVESDKAWRAIEGLKRENEELEETGGIDNYDFDDEVDDTEIEELDDFL